MVKAIVQYEPGGPEVLRWEEHPIPATVEPGAVLVRHTAIGVNFIDVYHRKGRYPVASYPAVIGAEGVGVVEAVGLGVSQLKAGDRIGYAMRSPGSYCEKRVVPAAATVRLPHDIPDDVAAVLMLKGMTAEMLLHRAYAVKPGDAILIHAAAGGMGLLLCQWAKALGAHVIGTTSTPEKAALAKTYGCDEVILYGQDDFVVRTRALTGGNGAQAVYDGVGRDTFQKSLDALGLLGTMVTYGAASGPVEPFDLTKIAANSITLIRPTVFHYTQSRERLEQMAARTFDAYRTGKLRPEVRKKLPLKDAAEAHRALESRETVGALVLIP